MEKPDIVEPTVWVGGASRPVALAYARRLLPRARLTEPDPHCRACGHRALDHGLADVPADQRHRWFNREQIRCQWPLPAFRAREDEQLLQTTPRPCECPEWLPGVWARTSLVHVGEARVLQTWIEVPVGAWIVAYRLANDHGTPVVGELRMFPAERGRPGPGDWSGELLGPEAPVPRGGITARVLRRVRVRAYLTTMSEVVRRFRTTAPDIAPKFGWAVAPPPTDEVRAVSGRGRKGRPDTFYAEVARGYVAAVERGSYRPVADLARRRRDSITKVRDMIRRARARGLLTLEGPGKRGGVLTERAERLLQRRRPGRRQRRA